MAYILQPGDGTKYYAVVSDVDGGPKVAIMNESFADVITIVPYGKGYHSVRKDTNPWTVEAARELIEIWKREAF